MELITVTWILCFIATLAYYIYLRGKPKEGWPAGPWRLPFIGNGHKMVPLPHVQMSKWVKEYGPIYSAQMGPFEMIVLSDAKLVKEAFSNPLFSGRPNNESFNIFSGGAYGILAAEGDVWTEQRRFTIRHLRDMGLGKNSMELLIMEEINEFLQWLKTEEGKPVNLSNRFSLAVLNSLWMILHGIRYKHDDPRLQAIFRIHKDAATTVASSGISFICPWLAKLMPNISGWGKLTNFIDNFISLFRESINEHKETIGDGDDDDPRDFVDAYLREMKNQAKTESSFNEKDGMKNLLAVLTDLFLAGYETTSITLRWMFLYLSLNQRVLKKIQNEIDTVVGKSRQPNLSDRPNMNYTEAVINEVLRITSIAPIGAFHTATQSTEFHGYKITKDAVICHNAYFIHHNPAIWGDPENFRPERFLTEDGKSLVKNENFLPFSTGKRVCLGESLSREELFLFTTNICQRFDIALDPQNSNPSLEPELGFFLAPKQYLVIMKDRFK